MNNKANTDLVNALNNCANACNYCTASCLQEPDVNRMAMCIKLDIDCAALCSLTASFLARNSVHGEHLLSECAELCNLCANECERHPRMLHCTECAEACRQCEEACKMAA
jgi:hypothetical protein